MLLLNRYELLKGYGNHSVSVGFGSYGQVKLALDRTTGQNVAVKIIRKSAVNEVVFHQELSHPNIIQLLGYHIDPEKELTFMILEYADGGTLFEKIRNGLPTKKEVKSYFRNICEAISYLHDHEIMHRDIKPENVLLTKKGKAKLCDFGFAAILGERKTLCGTYEYMSPEMIQNRPYDYKIDIWALGILLFELISGKAPFQGSSPEEVLDQMKMKIFFNERFTQEEINLIKVILRVTPNKRPTIKEILDNPYFLEDDTASTKESEIGTKEQKSFPYRSNIEKNEELKTPNMQKVQQNSYPFYPSKMQKQPERYPERYPETQKIEKIEEKTFQKYSERFADKIQNRQPEKLPEKRSMEQPQGLNKTSYTTTPNGTGPKSWSSQSQQTRIGVGQSKNLTVSSSYNSIPSYPSYKY